MLHLHNFLFRSMDGVEEDEYTSDPIAQQTRQVGVFLWQTLSLFE